MKIASDPMPVFTIQAKDRLAVAALVAYQALCDEWRLPRQAEEVEKAIDEMVAWRQRNPQQVKMPDRTHVPAMSIHKGAS